MDSLSRPPPGLSTLTLRKADEGAGVNEANDRGEVINENLALAMREVLRAVRDLDYGSVEMVVHNSRVVQIERKQKLRLDKPRIRLNAPKMSTELSD